MSEFITLFIPFAGTTLGSAMVFLMKDKISPLVEKALLGFAAGVMIAASIWSLLGYICMQMEINMKRTELMI